MHFLCKIELFDTVSPYNLVLWDYKIAIDISVAVIIPILCQEIILGSNLGSKNKILIVFFAKLDFLLMFHHI